MTHTSTEQHTETLSAWARRVAKEQKNDSMDAYMALKSCADRIDELEAAQAQRVPLSDELPQGFLSDVLTAAGLVSHGKQCKALGSRIGEAVEAIWKISIKQREAIAAHGITQAKQGATNE